MKYDVVFEGGGAKGISFLGAYAEMQARGHSIDRIVGTSAGAIFASLIAVGYDAEGARAVVARRDQTGTLLLARFMDPPQELSSEFIETSELMRYLDQIDIPLMGEDTERKIARTVMSAMAKIGPLRQLILFMERGGFNEGDVFVSWLRGLFEERNPGLGDATFEQLFAYTGTDLSLVASDLDDRRMLVLNHRTAPRLPVVMAVRMSMGIPVVWKDMRWDPAWGPYMGRSLDGHAVVDGGLLSNFPMHLIATDLAEVVEVMGPNDPRKVPNLGFLIDEELADPSFTLPPAENRPPFQVLQRMSSLVKTSLEARDRYVIERCIQNNEVCRLPAKGYGTTEFDMTEERFNILVASGRRAAAAWFDAEEARLAAGAG